MIADYPTTTFEEALQIASDFENMSEFIDTLNPSMFDLTAGTPAAAAPLLYDIEVRQDAYSRSSHGFHTLSFRSAAGLTEAQRLALRLIYARLASTIKLRRRARAIARSDSPDHAVVRLDRGALLSRRGAPEAKIPALDCVLQLAAWEADALGSVLETRGGWTSREELRRTAVVAGASRPGDWLPRLMNGGMVEAIAAA